MEELHLALTPWLNQKDESLLRMDKQKRGFWHLTTGHVLIVRKVHSNTVGGHT